MRTGRMALGGLVALVLLAALPFAAGEYVLGLLTLAFYFAVFAMAWDLLFGFAGEVNFGPSFLTGIGAYAAGLLNHLRALAHPGLRRRRRAGRRGGGRGARRSPR